jgi:hypothetical protein
MASPTFDEGRLRSELASRWHAYTYAELKDRCQSLGGGRYLIEGILPERSLGLLVGDSGIGKSPLAYQMAMCVASGTSFLGHPVREAGPVLCIDYENGLGQVGEILTRLAKHLELSEVPGNMTLFNFNDSPPDWESAGRTAAELIRDVKPTLVTIDSLAAYCPNIEEKNTVATQRIKDLRSIVRDVGCSILPVHHIRKPAQIPGQLPESLERGDFRKWFLQARGPRSLVNGTDVRIGVDAPSGASKAALVLRGFGRIRGEIPTMYIERVADIEGEPLGYRRMAGSHLLFNASQEEAFAGLGSSFRFKEAKHVYGKADQATTDFLKKCIAVGILRSPGRGQYHKVGGVDGVSL